MSKEIHIKTAAKIKCNKCGYEIYTNLNLANIIHCKECFDKKLEELGVGRMEVVDE